MSITVSETAAAHIRRHLQKRGKGIGLRLGVRLTGCSGMAYKLDYVDEPIEGDPVVDVAGIKVFVDPKSLPFIDGTHVDYGRDGLNEGFRFHNPKEKASCGCGESFTV